MKKIYNKFLSAAMLVVGATALTGCIDETEPTTVATSDQIAQSASAVEGLTLAMPAYLNHGDDSWTDRGHCYFGYPTIMHIRDVMTGDLGHNQSRYSHWRRWEENQYQGDGYLFAQYVWNYFYAQVLASNNVIGVVNEETATSEVLGYLGAGYAYRAMCYLDMARMYEFLPNDKTSSVNADGNDISGLTVPIVKAGMSEDAARENPRATRQEMAAFIEEDLDNAERLIGNLTTTSGNTLPDLAAVYGLKARLYMWLENYAKAQEYARKAINTTSQQPMSQEAALNIATGFNTASQFMWASQLTKEDYSVQTGIVNWAAWMTNQTSFGYTGVSTGLYLVADRRFYERISDTDWRKLEFKAPEDSPLASQVPYLDKAAAAEMPDYTAIKFRPGNGNADDYNTGAAVAIPIMRVEEMYFIEAEAAAHQNASQGKQLVENFMKSYRDASYTCRASSTDDVVEEIVFQKRVELWGEGQSYFDIKRLNYSVTRAYEGSNHYDLTRFNTNGRPAWMNFVIVRNESNNNSALKGYNNPDPSDVYVAQ